jgi:hypothetical protein
MLDLPEYDIEYSELLDLRPDFGQSHLYIRLLCSKPGWYWIEKVNGLRRLLRLQARVSEELVEIELDGVDYVQRELIDYIERNGWKFPLELGALNASATQDSLHVEADDQPLEVRFASCTVRSTPSDPRHRLKTAPSLLGCRWF